MLLQLAQRAFFNRIDLALLKIIRCAFLYKIFKPDQSKLKPQFSHFQISSDVFSFAVIAVINLKRFACRRPGLLCGTLIRHIPSSFFRIYLLKVILLKAVH